MKDEENNKGNLDQLTRVEDLRRQVEELHGGVGLSFKSDDLPAEIEEEFLKHIIAYETATPTTLFDELVKSGVSLPAPEEITDADLSDKLWEIIDKIASFGVSLENTDHLSDRELYKDLWQELFREEAILFPDEPNYTYHLDVIGSGSEEDTLIYLKYYADEDYRENWMKDWPDYIMPEREPLPYDRDRHMPQRHQAENDSVM